VGGNGHPVHAERRNDIRIMANGDLRGHDVRLAVADGGFAQRESRYGGEKTQRFHTLLGMRSRGEGISHLRVTRLEGIKVVTNPPVAEKKKSHSPQRSANRINRYTKIQIAKNPLKRERGQRSLSTWGPVDRKGRTMQG